MICSGKRVGPLLMVASVVLLDTTVECSRCNMTAGSLDTILLMGYEAMLKLELSLFVMTHE